MYDKMDENVRKSLWLRAYHKAGWVYANKALSVRDTFVQVCLVGQRSDGQDGPPDMAASAQVEAETLAKLVMIHLLPVASQQTSSCHYLHDKYACAVSVLGLRRRSCLFSPHVHGHKCLQQMTERNALLLGTLLQCLAQHQDDWQIATLVGTLPVFLAHC